MESPVPAQGVWATLPGPVCFWCGHQNVFLFSSFFAPRDFQFAQDKRSSLDL